MGSEKETAMDGGTVSRINQEELYTTVYSATKDAMLAVMAKAIYLLLSTFFIFGGVMLALSNSGLSSIAWGIGTSIIGFVIAAAATGVLSRLGGLT